jgi:cycloeucalenol cycloisomerase
MSGMAADGAPRWFSENPSKAWGEKFFLAYSPVWMTVMALVMGLGVTERLGEWGFLAIGVAVALPLMAVPALTRDERPLGRRWYQTGMVYDYPMIDLNLDAALVGSGEQRVPLIMYLLTQAYFLTYHTTAVVVLRRIRTSGVPIGAMLWPLLLLAVAYFWAWMETKAMANPWIASQFYYKDMERMLRYGSLFYSLYFIASFPIFYHLDERRDTSWSLAMTAAAALSASMIMMFLLDFAAAIFGPLT